MIKFFRKIRYNLMETGKTGKYLKYAIGEVVLVVIGILIALSINNWNQSQQQAKVEIATLKALGSEFKENRNSIQSCLENITQVRLYGDSLRMQIGPKMTALTVYDVNRLFAEIGSTLKCNVSIDILKDIQSSGKLNLITSEEIRRSISKWSSYLNQLEGEENDWAQEFSNQFIPFTNKWIQWDDVDFSYNRDDPRYYKSRFTIDPRLVLQNPEFSNIMAIQYWRIERIQTRINLLLMHTDKLLVLIQQELEE